MSIILDMFCNVDHIRKTVKDGRVIYKPRTYGDFWWPDHVIKLAKAIKDATTQPYEKGNNCFFALHDALLELGLPKNAAHFVEGHCILRGLQYECTHADIIARNGNPDWGNTYWCVGEFESYIVLLEQQEELEKWWGFKPHKRSYKRIQAWCERTNNGPSSNK